jgi:3',5'-cyclic AMP phosphodiesterase CpdA
MIRFIHMSDSHLGVDTNHIQYGRNTWQDAKAMVEFINHDLDFEPDFVLHTGDVLNQPDANASRLAADLFKTLRFPAWYVVGNHDDRALMRADLLGHPPADGPLYYDFRVDEFHFMALDSRGDVDPQGFISADQLEWLAQTCKESDARSLAIVVHHLPLHLGVTWIDRDMRIMNDDVFFDVLRPHRERLRGMFFGHIHRATTGFRDGILCSASASTFMQFEMNPDDEQARFDTAAPAGYAIVTMTHTQTTVTHHTLPR